ncbi:MAG: hypothetical protein V4631_21100 [Pseudomonadota bacterium]
MSDQEQQYEQAAVSENEKFYDEEVAPVLAAVSELCASRGFSMVVAVEFDPGAIGTISRLPDTPTLAMIMLSHCAKTGDNIDGYVLGLLKFCKENDIDYSRSMVMRSLDPSQIILPNSMN